MALDDVVRALRHAGLTVDPVYDRLSIVMFTGSPAAAARARTVPGVTNVEKQLTFDVGPPQI